MPRFYRCIHFFGPVLFLFLLSCSGSRDFDLVPKEARLVITADFKNLALNAISFNSLLTGVSDTNLLKKSDQKKLENSGIDFLGKGLVFQLTENRGSDKFYFILPVSDKDAFFDFIRSMDSTSVRSKSYDLDWMTGRNMTVGVKGKTAVGLFDEFLNEDSKAKTFLRELLELKDEDQLINSNPRFQAFAEKSVDAGFWADLSKQGDFSQLPLASGIKLPGGEISGGLNFKDGRIEIKGTYFNDDPEVNQYSGIFENEVENSFLEKIPKADPQALIAFRMNMPLLQKLSEPNPNYQMGIAGLLALGIDPADLFAMCGGQVAVAIVGNPPEGQVIPKLAIQFSVKDKQIAEKVFKRLSDARMVSDVGSGHYLLPQMDGFEMHLTEDLLTISNMPLPWKGHFSPGKEKEFPTGTFLGFARFKDIAGSITPGSEARKNAENLSEFWESFSFATRNESESLGQFSLLIHSTRPDENAFLTMGNFIAKIKNSQSTPEGDVIDPNSASNPMPDLGRERD